MLLLVTIELKVKDTKTVIDNSKVINILTDPHQKDKTNCVMDFCTFICI